MDESSSSLTIQEAAEQLRELDRLLHQRRITGIAHRNRKERLLARIKQPASGRYMTRRQLGAPLEKNNSQPRHHNPYTETRLLRRDLDDFIVRGGGDDDDYVDDKDDGDDDDDDSAVSDDARPQPVETDERRALEEHFRSVTVRFNPEYRPMFPPRAPRAVQIDPIGPTRPMTNIMMPGAQGVNVNTGPLVQYFHSQ
jgi:hypothetical protein